jgi:ribosome-associated toxin RatA of RatAB toxin-antitoxin module
MRALVALAAAIATPTVTPFGVHGRTVSASIHIDRPPAAVYAVLTDYAHMHEFMPLVVRVEALESRETSVKVKFHFRAWGVYDFEEIDERLLEPHRSIRFTSLQGPLKSARGIWRMAPEGNGTLLSYEISAEPPFPLPGAVMDHLVGKSAVDLIDGIRLRAESGGTWRRP